MKVITFANHKGGTGKTTLCLNLGVALSLAEPKSKILFIDADPQSSLRNWHDESVRSLNLIVADKRQALWSAHRMAVDLHTDYMLIDTPARINDVTGAALTISNLAVVPIKPSPLDVWATVPTLDLLSASLAANQALKALIVINQAIKGSSMGKHVAKAINSIELHEHIQLADEVVHGRVAFARTVNTGNTVMSSHDKAAIEEINNLVESVRRLCGN